MTYLVESRPHTFLLLTIGFVLALAVPAAAKPNSCKLSRFAVPHTANLGEQEITVANTQLGKLTARKFTSGPTFFLGGQPLRRTSETTVPREASACLQKERTAVAHRKKAKQAPFEWVFCDERIRRCVAVVCLEDGSCGGATVDY
jgi:hypothetical protein